MKKIFKTLLIAFVVLLILVQFYPRASRIKPTEQALDITSIHAVPSQVKDVLESSCYDCHSNNTSYPWYASIQPVALWLDDHISEGRKELNFSEFGKYSLARQYRKLEEINKEVKEDEMPLQSYTLIHRDAKLTAGQKLLLSNWAEALRDSMQKNYPADSLVQKKK